MNDIIISLTSYPKRKRSLFVTLQSILIQQQYIKKIVVNISDKKEDFEFPQSDLIEVNIVQDLKSYKKLIPTLIKYPNDYILTIDDDQIYKDGFIKSFYEAMIQYPDCIFCGVSRAINPTKPYNYWTKNESNICSQLLLPIGFGGVLYPPNSLHYDVTNVDLFLKLCPTGDDLWFKIMGERQGSKYKCINIIDLIEAQPESSEGLKIKNMLLNNIMFRRLIKYYNLSFTV